MPIGPSRARAHARLALTPTFVLAFVVLAAPAGAVANHPREVGDGVVRLRSTTFLAGWTYDDEGRRTGDAGFVTEAVSLHVEAGVAPRLTLTGELPFVWIPERGLPSPGDAVLGGMVAILAPDAPVDLAVALDVKLPLYAAEGGPSIRGRAKDGLPAIGDGQVDGTASLVLVGPLPLGGAIDLYAGYRLRAGGVTDAVVGGGRAGIWLFDNSVFVSALLDTVITFDPATVRADAVPEIMGEGYAAGGARLSVRLVERVFLEMTALYVGRGQNAAGGAELGVGVSAAF